MKNNKVKSKKRKEERKNIRGQNSLTKILKSEKKETHLYIIVIDIDYKYRYRYRLISKKKKVFANNLEIFYWLKMINVGFFQFFNLFYFSIYFFFLLRFSHNEIIHASLSLKKKKKIYVFQ